MRVDVLVIAGKKLTLNVLIVNVLFAVVINLALHSNAQGASRSWKGPKGHKNFQPPKPKSRIHASGYIQGSYNDAAA